MRGRKRDDRPQDLLSIEQIDRVREDFETLEERFPDIHWFFNRFQWRFEALYEETSIDGADIEFGLTISVEDEGKYRVQPDPPCGHVKGEDLVSLVEQAINEVQSESNSIR